MPRDRPAALLGSIHLAGGRHVATLKPALPSHSFALSSPVARITPRHDPHYLPTPHKNSSPAHPSPRLYLPLPVSSLAAKYEQLPEPTSSYLPFKVETFSSEVAAVTRQLHKTLHRFKPTSDQYTEMPFEVAFNWDELTLPEDMDQEWFAIVTHSKHPDGPNAARKFKDVNDVMYFADSPHGIALYEVDEQAHIKAVQTGGVMQIQLIFPCQN